MRCIREIAYMSLLRKVLRDRFDHHMCLRVGPLSTLVSRSGLNPFVQQAHICIDHAMQRRAERATLIASPAVWHG